MRRFNHSTARGLISIAVVLVPLAGAASARADSTVSVARHSDQLQVKAKVADASLLAHIQLLIDADGDAKTGYLGAGADHGYDLLVEGSAVYHFKGTDPTAWSWDRVGTASLHPDGSKLEIDFDASLLTAHSSTAAVLLREISADYKVLGTVPATGVSTADLSGGTAAPSAVAAAPATAPAATTLSASATQDGGDLVLKITAASATDLNTVLVFLDTDANAATGFNPPADPRFGFEQMIQGSSLLQHTGSDRSAWSWLAVAPVKQTVTGNTEELRFNAALLKSSDVRMSLWQMSPDWQLRTAFFPQTSTGSADTLTVKLDASKLHADASMIDVPMAPAHADAALPPRERFKKAQSYVCYYGPGRAEAISHVDAAILHIPAQTPADIHNLNTLGVVTIGYISVGEDETLRVGNGRGPDGKASWYFDHKQPGKPDENGVWGSYFANAADPAWRADRVAQAKKLCGDGPDGYGFAGIFLDTLDTVEPYPQSRVGMVQLIGELRAALPDKVIVMNRGFTLLKEPGVAAAVDGLMFEDFTDSYNFDTKTYFQFSPSELDETRGVAESILMPAMKQCGLRVLALDYCPPDAAERIQTAVDRAATFGLIPGVASIQLDSIYDTWDLTPHPNPKYLSRLADPASLQVTLDTARNGFPAGTVVTPSSDFIGYSAAAVVDGVADRSHLDWSKRAWASSEQPGEAQQLLFSLPAAVNGGTLRIDFAVEDGHPYPSRAFDVEVRADSHAVWQVVASPKDQHQTTFTCPLPATPVREICIKQSPDGGSAGRPDLMWVAQVRRVD